MNEKVFGTKKQGSIKDIPLPQDSRDYTLHLGETDGGAKAGGGMDGWKQAKSQNKRFGFKILLGVILLLVLLALYSFLFHRATVEVLGKAQNVVISNQEFQAELQSDTDGLEFIRVTPFAKTESIYVEGSIEENRQTKSSGVVTVYNTDTTEKNYVKNTRFQSPDGNVYRAFNRFVIPGGSESNPGTVEVLVVAENPGEKYNSEAGLSFTLPALKEQGDPAYNHVYAEQKEPLIGGYSGVVRVPIEDDLEEAEIKLSARLDQALRTEFVESLPDHYIFNEKYLAISEPSFTQQPEEERGGVTLVARAELYAVVFDKEIFEEFMAEQLLDQYEGEEVDIANINELSVAITEEDFNPQTASEFEFTITGEAEFVWPVDKNQLATLLAGNLKSHIQNNLVVGLDHVEITDVAVRPFWRRSLPNNAERIDININ